MAEDAIENELNCSICLDTYTDPKILQCFHIYCQKCLVKLVVQDQQGQLLLSCPICRQVTSVPASGTAGLQSAFHINRLLEILDQHKRATGESVSSSNAKSLSPQSNLTLHCSEHATREVELFCESCGELICVNCVTQGSKHHSHDFKNIHESFARYREEVTPLLEPMEKKMVTTIEVLTQLDRQCEEITDQQAAITAKIRDSSKRLHEIIEKRENELIGQLDQITKRKLKRLAKQKEQIETLLAQLSSCLDFTKESLKTDTQHPEVLASILKQARELITSSQPEIFTLNTDAGLVFSGLADAAAACKSYGRVSAPNSPDPSKCVLRGKRTEEAVVEQKATLILEAVSFEGRPCTGDLTSCSVELVSEITGIKLFGSVEHSRDQGQYVVSYQPTVKGRHQLHIKAVGQHISGSPFSVTVRLPVAKLGTPIRTLNLSNMPWGVAITGKEEVVVIGYSKHCVLIFSLSGEKLQSFGSGRGQFQSPTGVTLDGEGNIFVADKFNHQIQKFTYAGQFIDSVGREGTLQFNEPCGIAYNPTNNFIYVADRKNHQIQVLTSDLMPITILGMRGRSEGQFFCPRGVAIGSTGRVYVADSGNYRIQVFTAEGEFLSMFGRRGEGRGELNWPFGIAVDASGLVYVSEYENHRVSVFTSEGKFVTSFGSKGREPGQFDTPRGLAVDSSGVVYVCDSYNNRVQIF